MSFDTAVSLMRSWGREVVVLGDSDGRSNGIGWRYGKPIGQINHHLVVGMDPAKTPDYVAMVRNGYSGLSGPIVQTLLGVQGRLYLIATGPCNHAGQGAQSVVDRILSGRAPAGAAANVGASDTRNMNDTYVGTEPQHPGDATPWPDIMIDVLVDWNAALSIAFGWGDDGHACIQHYESTNRKIDMSWRGGPDGDAGPELRRRVAARIAAYRNGTSPTTPEIPEDELDMDEAALRRIVREEVKNAMDEDLTVRYNTWGPNDPGNGETPHDGSLSDALGEMTTMLARTYRTVRGSNPGK